MFADFQNRISTLSLRKVLNILLVQLSYGLSVILKKPLVWGKPFFISLEPASVCNLACPQCPTGAGEVRRRKRYMDMNCYQAILNEIAGTTLILSLYHQGEPMMHKSFTDLVRYARDRNIYTITASNGQLLTRELCRGLVEAGLDRIIISLDGTDQESYSQYRIGGDFRKVTDGIRFLSQARLASRKPYIIIQFLIFKHNQHQVAGIKKLGKALGADRIVIKSAQIEYPGSMDGFMPDQAKYRRYRKDSQGDWILKGKIRNRCKRLWQTTVITADGLVVPCCFDKLARYPMGTTASGNISRIWKNRDYNEFRQKILHNRKGIGICTNCTEGVKGIYR
jgi:radical SAM protein with 4Fe4S-binding SPASM domain